MRRTAIAVCLLALIAVASISSGTIIHVDPGDSGYSTIQEGINAASDGDTVLIAPGTYRGPNNRNLTLDENENLVIEAEDGFPTVTIDCEGQDRAILLDMSGQDTTTVIRGLVIRNGATPDYDGGGIYLNGVSIVIEDCLIEDCVATNNGGGAWVGYMDPGAGTHIRNCVFRNNTASYTGGGLKIDHASAYIRECLFCGNSTTASGTGSFGGGGIYLQAIDEGRYYECRVTSCTLVDNYSAADGSGLMGWNSVGTTFIERCIIAFNWGPGLGVHSSPLFDGFTFTVVYGNQGGNIAPGYSVVLEEDPLFCDFYSDDFTLCEESPALPDGNPWNMLMGFADQGCSAPCSTPVEHSSWGRIKSLYR